MAALVCNACNNAMEVDVSNPRIMYAPHTILIVIEHKGEMICPHCQTVVMPAVVALPGMGFAMVPKPSPPQNKVIPVAAPGVPGGGKLITP